MKKKKNYAVGPKLILAAFIMLAAVGVWFWLFVVKPGAGGLSDPGRNSELPRQTGMSVTRSADTVPQTGTDPAQVPKAARKDGFYNFLVVGRDASGGNTDVIMLCSLDSAAGSFSILQIPRDSYVSDPVNFDKNKKINAIYAHAYNQARETDPDMSNMDRQRYALKYLCGVVGRQFGVDIDRYVYVDLKAFREIVDIIGGVEVNVPRNLDYDDPDQNLHIHIKKGVQVLKGKNAEGFVRFRSGYAEADLARLDAQKIFMSALAKKLLSADSVGRIPQLMSSAYDHMITDLDLGDVSFLAGALAGLDTSAIVMVTAPGESFRSQSGAAFYGLYREDSLKLVNKYFNCFSEDITVDKLGIVEMSNTGSGDRTADDVYSADDINDSKLRPQ